MSNPTLAERFDDLLQAVAEDAVRSSTPLPSGRGTLDPDSGVRRDVADFRAELEALDSPPPVVEGLDPAVWPIRGVRVDGDSVIVLAKGGNDAARFLCGAILALRDAQQARVVGERLSRVAAAIATLERMGYAWVGGEQWRPPLGQLGGGLSPVQEPKYTVRGTSLVTRATGVPIPPDEPVFILRARDVHASQALKYYAVQCGETAHCLAVMDRIDDFDRFARRCPDRMKVPDTAEPRWDVSAGAEGGSDAAH